MSKDKVFVSLLSFVILILIFSIFMVSFSEPLNVQAEEITSNSKFSLSSVDSENKEINVSKLSDDDYTTYTSFDAGDALTIKSDTPIASVYIVWNKVPGEWKLIAEQKEYLMGKNGFLHEFVDVVSLFGMASSEITITMPKDISICDIYTFSEGELPNWVQTWQAPCEKADIMLLSTHSDDEQLFFAGVLPYYAGEVDAAVQVVYLTNHWDTQNRPHEQINGLWTVGVKNYPIVGHFPDDVNTLNRSGESVQETLERVLEGSYDETGTWNEANLIKFQVEMIRRFKPQVIVAHDINGEYQHGAHIANTDTMIKALAPAADMTQYTELASEYGVWDVPKVYIHLYENNTIEMNWDTPLEKFGGKTAFEVSKDGYGCHYSQHWTWFTRWLNTGTNVKNAEPVTKASEFTLYSPCKYGLYRSLVGEDTKADFLDNITMYKDQAPEEPEHTEEPSTPSVNPSTPTEIPNTTINKKGLTSLQRIVIYCIITICIIALLIVIIIKVNKKYR